MAVSKKARNLKDSSWAHTWSSVQFLVQVLTLWAQLVSAGTTHLITETKVLQFDPGITVSLLQET